MHVLRVEALPEDALAASARFHSQDLPAAKAALAAQDDLTLVFAPADHTHRGWRLAAVQGLAREHAPLRVNAIAGDDEAGIAAALRYLQSAPGVTGQLLPLDSIGADEVLY
jgi:hypothetical protein